MSRRVALFGRFLARKRGDLARAACLNVHCKGRHQAAFCCPASCGYPWSIECCLARRLYEPGSVVFPYRSCAGRRRFGDRPWRHLEVSYVTATNGGGAFLLMFLLFSFTLGVAVLVGETLLGSRSQRGCSVPSTSWWGRTGAGWGTWGSCAASSSTASTAWWAAGPWVMQRWR